MRQILSVLLFSYVLFWFGCAGKPRLSLDTITFRDVRSRVEQNHWKLSTLKGYAQISIETAEMGLQTGGQVALKMPDSLAIKMRAGFGIGVGSVFVDKNRFLVYSPMQNVAYFGDVHSKKLRELLPIQVEVKELFNVISGIPVITETKNCSLAIDDDKYLIVTNIGPFKKKYWIDPRRFVVTDIRIYDKNDELFVEQEFRQFRKDRGVYLPSLIRLYHPKRKNRITLLYNNRTTNKKIKPTDFIIKISDKTERIIL